MGRRSPSSLSWLLIFSDFNFLTIRLFGWSHVSPELKEKRPKNRRSEGQRLGCRSKGTDSVRGMPCGFLGVRGVEVGLGWVWVGFGVGLGWVWGGFGGWVWGGCGGWLGGLQVVLDFDTCCDRDEHN